MMKNSAVAESALTSPLSQRAARMVLVFIRWKETPKKKNRARCLADLSRGDNVGTSVVRTACSPVRTAVTEKTGRRISVSYSGGGREVGHTTSSFLLGEEHSSLLSGNSCDREVAAIVTLDATARHVLPAISSLFINQPYFPLYSLSRIPSCPSLVPAWGQE